MNQGLAPCEQLLERHGVHPALCTRSWEVGRLVLGPEYRSGPEALKRCLYLTLVYLLEHTDVENLFASCTPVLSRLYRRFGFNILVKDACQDAQGSYCLIHGTVPAVLRALATTEAEKEAAEEILALRSVGELLPC
jgi:hypothetical protein